MTSLYNLWLITHAEHWLQCTTPTCNSPYHVYCTINCSYIEAVFIVMRWLGGSDTLATKIYILIPQLSPIQNLHCSPSSQHCPRQLNHSSNDPLWHAEWLLSLTYTIPTIIHHFSMGTHLQKLFCDMLLSAVPWIYSFMALCLCPT